MLLQITFYSIVSLTWACVVIVILTFLRLVVAAVTYTSICFIVASILWFLFVLLTETWHGVAAYCFVLSAWDHDRGNGRCDSDMLALLFLVVIFMDFILLI